MKFVFIFFDRFSCVDAVQPAVENISPAPLIEYDRKAIDLMIANGQVGFREKKVVKKKGCDRSVQSPIWKTFQIILNKETNTDIPKWYICINCNEPIQNKYKDGTTTKFHRHLKVRSFVYLYVRSADMSHLKPVLMWVNSYCVKWMLMNLNNDFKIQR